MIQRNLNLDQILKQKSVLLLGPRATGKSFYIKHQIENTHVINLLRNADFMRLSADHSLLEKICLENLGKTIVIDEIQKIPSLLDEVHHLIEEYKIKFLLTGSSARKLKGESVNLLAGRAWLAEMHPLNSSEIGKYDMLQVLNYGTLPVVFGSTNPIEELDNYVQTYIQAEIKSEGLIRKIPAFSRFLKTASLASGELLNFQNISNDSATPVSTLKEYYHILQDTLIGRNLEPWIESKKRKAIATAKFYFFDNGVLNTLTENFIDSKSSPLYGNRLEHFILNELVCANSYQRRKCNINFWRSTSKYEVDFIFGDTAIELKSTSKVSNQLLSGLQALREEKKHKRYILISNDPIERKEDSIQLMNIHKFLARLWSGEF